MMRGINKWIWRQAERVFSPQTVESMKLDLRRYQVRRLRKREGPMTPPCSKLHMGCGTIHVEGWLNVDLYGSDCDVDLAGGWLPWMDNVFDAVVSQHVIEHLELETEVLPLLRELRRVLKPGAEIWLSCPDIEKICRSYQEHEMRDLLEDRRKRWPDFPFGEMPTSHLMNHLFCQEGGHRNLFDFALMEWTLEQAGFVDVHRVEEADLLERFPAFPAREDDAQSLYARARNTD